MLFQRAIWSTRNQSFCRCYATSRKDRRSGKCTRGSDLVKSKSASFGRYPSFRLFYPTLSCLMSTAVNRAHSVPQLVPGNTQPYTMGFQYICRRHWRKKRISFRCLFIFPIFSVVYLVMRRDRNNLKMCPKSLRDLITQIPKEFFLFRSWKVLKPSKTRILYFILN